jgi:hypothetical protein
MNDTAPAAEGQAGDAPAPEAQGQASEAEQAAWYDSAPDEVKGYIQNKGWDDPMKAVNSYQELEKYRGASEDELIKLPKEGEPWDEVYTKLGRPEAPEGYEWDAPDGVQVDTQRLGQFQQKAHEIGLNPAQFKQLVDLDAEYGHNAMAEMQEATQQKQAAELAEVQKEWGEAFDERAEIGRRFVSNNLPEGMDKAGTLDAIENAIGTAAMLKLFANAGVSANAKEDRLPDSGGDRPYGYTPEQAKADRLSLMSELNADPVRLDNYNKAIGPDYDKMQRILKLAAG